MQRLLRILGTLGVMLLVGTAASLWCANLQDANAQDTLPVTVPVKATLVFRSELLAELGKLADTATTEHFRCLLGAIDRNHGVVDLAYEPHIDAASKDSVVPDVCPAGTIAEWHNHIVLDTLYVPLSWCIMSMPDVARASENAAPFYFISVNHETLCWWSQEQVKRALELYPPEAFHQWGGFPPLVNQVRARKREQERP